MDREHAYAVDEVVLQGRGGSNMSMNVDPLLQKAVLSCEQGRDENGDPVHRIVVDIQNLATKKLHWAEPEQQSGPLAGDT